ncbi:proprotein convertase subtilisin/kexin type 5-like, partial [Ruditapes philippinarum]|uniref:proprotein convertase subtilisin/kexin type 5-like n=1 Tax=Ruditapes philippinarum TaxID=129788 RepID=UPI00295B6DCE
MYPNIITNSFIKCVVTVFFFHVGVVECQLLCTSSSTTCPPHKPYCTAGRCVFECPESAYVNGTECVAECGILFVFNKTCVDHCPRNTILRETPKLLGREIYIEKLCVTSCDRHEYIYNGTCVKACPPTHKYINENNCTTSCPQIMPFIRNETVNGISIHKCVKECEYLIEDNFCTKDCVRNKYIFNSSCVDQCPASHSFLYNQYCEQTCPGMTVIFGSNTCLFRCPIDYPYVFNNRCVNRCPNESAYAVSKHNGLHCSTECPPMMFNYDFTCVEKCPNGTVIDNKMCRSQCSKHRPYSCIFQNNNPCSVDIHDVAPNQTMCLEFCPANMFTHDMTCVSTCPNNTVFVNRTCLSECPHNYHFIIQRTIAVKCCQELYRNWECLLECPTGTFLFNSTCVYACPNFTFTFGNSCVTECPIDQRLLLQSRKTVTQWKLRENGWDSLNGTVDAGFICLKSCPSDKKIYNVTCYDQCPAKLYLNGNECVDKCPPENPYEYKEYTPWTCIRSCKDKNSFFHDGLCTSNCPEPLIGYDGLCTDKCQDGFIWWYEECSKRTDAVKTSAITFGIGIMLLGLGMNIVKEYFTFLYMALRMKPHHK